MIELRKVGKSFASRVLFKNVTATLEAGRVHLLTGGNGSGKSTLLRMIAGLTRPTAGEIVLEDEDVLMGYLGHATFTYGNLTAVENLAFWRRAYGQAASEKDILSMLAHVGLAPFAHTRAGVFSRGMTQRLALARVLLLKPAVYLLDEPETGLDKASRELLHDEMKKARDNGACVVWVSHLARDTRLADVEYELTQKTLVERPLEARDQTLVAGEGAC